MSSEAKAWQDDQYNWHAVHDCDCKGELQGDSNGEHHGTEYDLLEVIREVNSCLAPHPILRWTLHVYPDGKAGLRGYRW